MENTNNSLEFGKACEELHRNHNTSPPHRTETNCIAEWAVRRVKEGTCVVLFQPGLDDMLLVSAQRPRHLVRWKKNTTRTTIRRTILLANHTPLGRWCNTTRFLRKTRQDSTDLTRRSSQTDFSYALYAGGIGKETSS